MALAVALIVAISTLADPGRAAEPAGIVSRIKRAPVESSALAAVGYSRRIRALEIEFRNGAIYRYFDVPPSIYRALLVAPSKARFYDHNIRHKFRSTHVRRPRLR
ncbi:MAG TPA: KTSC domain-containing protein [Chthoniobacterales bacterium]|nr:KTSC domain-containing protein [Chthoniobacterales bacterium]